MEFNPGKICFIPISKVVAPVLGIAKKGPMQRTIIVPNILLNVGLTLLHNLSILPPALDTAIIPKSGIPIPVKKNPTVDNIHFEPDCIPNSGGNIKLPAPKNIANNANPTTNASLFFLLTINTPPKYYTF